MPTDEESEDNPYKQLAYKQYSLLWECFGIPISQALELDNLEFNILLRDAICMTLAKVNPEYLEEAWRFKQTKPDRSGLRETFGD